MANVMSGHELMENGAPSRCAEGTRPPIHYCALSLAQDEDNVSPVLRFGR